MHLVLLGLLAFNTGGCVMNSTYQAAVKETETIKGDLERTKEEQQILAEQVRGLEKLNAEMSREVEHVTAVALETKRDFDSQQRQAEVELARLKRKIPQLIRQYDALRGELAVAKENGAALQELVDVYQKKLADLRKNNTSFASPVISQAPPPFDPTALPPPQSLPEAAVAPEPSNPPAAVKTPAPDPSMAGRRDSKPEDSGWFSAITTWIRSLWQSLFS